MNSIKNKLLVMSGKGGVGKTTVAVNLAYLLAKKGSKVGLLDVDIHGPNVPKMLKIENEKLKAEGNKMFPFKVNDNLQVMSMAFLLNKSDAVIWRGPMKHNVIKQFIEDVLWGSLDYLVIDFPPGTGDEAISVSQLLKGITGSVIVSTPQQVSLIDVEKSIAFSRNVNIPIIGVIENMSGSIFGQGTVTGFAASMGVPFLGTINMDKDICEAGDNGVPFVEHDGTVTDSFNEITNKIILSCDK